MGLDISHNTWSGAYSAFMRWRCAVAHAAGLPPLELMEGFFFKDQAVTGNPFWCSYEEDKKLGYLRPDDLWSRLPIKWSSLRPSPLHYLLYHSDCDGHIPWKRCGRIADALEAIIDKMPQGEGGGHIGDWRATTEKFIAGLRLAHSKRESVKFA